VSFFDAVDISGLDRTRTSGEIVWMIESRANLATGLPVWVGEGGDSSAAEADGIEDSVIGAERLEDGASVV